MASRMETTRHPVDPADPRPVIVIDGMKSGEITVSGAVIVELKHTPLGPVSLLADDPETTVRLPYHPVAADV